MMFLISVVFVTFTQKIPLVGYNYARRAQGLPRNRGAACTIPRDGVYLYFIPFSVADSLVQELKGAQLRLKDKMEQNEAGSTSSSSELPRSSSQGGVQLDSNGLVIPKKIFNPCADSRDRQELHREIRWNAKA